MNKEDCRERVEHLAENLKQEFIRKAMELYSCGGVDTDLYENNYVLPRILLAASHKSVCGNMTFGSDYYRKEIKNLERF